MTPLPFNNDIGTNINIKLGNVDINNTDNNDDNNIIDKTLKYFKMSSPYIVGSIYLWNSRMICIIIR